MNFADKIREAATEGSVLLKNENKTLPYTDADSVSIFGRAQIDYYQTGIGSGGEVNAPYKTNLLGGMLRKKSSGHNPLINKELSHIYTKWLKDNPAEHSKDWQSEPWSQKEMPIDEVLAGDAAAISNKAVFVIARTAGEMRDNAAVEGGYYLTRTERDVLRIICNAFKQVTVVLNIAGIIDMSWMNDDAFNGHITAVLISWFGGMEGGNATADILCGVSTPSGKLADTIASSINDYPAVKNFGGVSRNVYEEDIFVGYRYFETFARDKIAFPFGFGLSYTTFSLSVLKASDKKGIVTIIVRVKNTGKQYFGKETIQVYYEAPQGKLGKSARVLCAFIKTKLLKPGESEKVMLSFSLQDMASYDDSGITGYKSCYVLEEGSYYLYVGTDSHTATRIKIDGNDSIHILSTMLMSRQEQACAPVQPFKRMHPSAKKNDGTYDLLYEDVPLNEVDLQSRINKNIPESMSITGNQGITFTDVRRKPFRLDAFVAQLNKEELTTLVRGEGMESKKVTSGIAGAFGGVSEALYKYGIPVAGCSDGPSGVRMTDGTQASLMPDATMLACTWNVELVAELYMFEGKELASHKIDMLLGPGMNIHRCPLNGRNFEYYSEDPFVTGVMADAALMGLKAGGVSGTVKHMTANNQEANRYGVDAVVSERALREIYLSAFEHVVRQGHADAIMTSYNPLNGHMNASNYDLTNTILRKEFHFNGLVMSDWFATMNDCVTGGEHSNKKIASMIRARNDLYMVVDNDGAEKNCLGDDGISSLAEGKLSLAEIQLCAKDIISFLIRAPVSKRKLRPLEQKK